VFKFHPKHWLAWEVCMHLTSGFSAGQISAHRQHFRQKWLVSQIRTRKIWPQVRVKCRKALLSNDKFKYLQKWVARYTTKSSIVCLVNNRLNLQRIPLKDNQIFYDNTSLCWILTSLVQIGMVKTPPKPSMSTHKLHPPAFFASDKCH
jgi:hypothetical protein